jgi:hypothetical protein
MHMFCPGERFIVHRWGYACIVYPSVLDCSCGESEDRRRTKADSSTHHPLAPPRRQRPVCGGPAGDPGGEADLVGNLGTDGTFPFSSGKGLLLVKKQVVLLRLGRHAHYLTSEGASVRPSPVPKCEGPGAPDAGVAKNHQGHPPKVPRTASWAIFNAPYGS